MSFIGVNKSASADYNNIDSGKFIIGTRCHFIIVFHVQI